MSYKGLFNFSGTSPRHMKVVALREGSSLIISICSFKVVPVSLVEIKIQGRCWKHCSTDCKRGVPGS